MLWGCHGAVRWRFIIAIGRRERDRHGEVFGGREVLISGNRSAGADRDRVDT